MHFVRDPWFAEAQKAQNHYSGLRHVEEHVLCADVLDAPRFFFQQTTLPPDFFQGGGPPPRGFFNGTALRHFKCRHGFGRQA